MPIDKERAIELFNAEEERIVILNGGSKWFIKPFIAFQYGELNQANRAHSSVIAVLLKEGIKPLVSPLEGAKDKDKDKDKDKEKDTIWVSTEKDFEIRWTKYPNKDGRKESIRHFKASIKSPEDLLLIDKALDNYLRHLAMPENTWKHPKSGSTWFNNWRDWVAWKEPKESATRAPTSTGALAKQRAEEAAIESERKAK